MLLSLKDLALRKHNEEYTDTKLEEVNNAIDSLTLSAVPVGAVLFDPLGLGWPGFLEADGSSFDTGVYPDLAELYPSGILPDFTDRVPRGAGPLAGTAGVTQEDAMQGHWHQQLFGSASVPGPSLTASSINQTANGNILLANVRDAITDGVNGTPRIAEETRVKSWVGKWYIKAYGAFVNAGDVDLVAIEQSQAQLTQAQQHAGVDYQEFYESDIWNKPSGTRPNSLIIVEMWGGGGGGGSTASSGAGGGGAYHRLELKASDVASSVAVTVGAGGALSSQGGTTSFGAHGSAYGGGGGWSANSGAGGGGGGITGAGSNATGAAGTNYGVGGSPNFQSGLIAIMVTVDSTVTIGNSYGARGANGAPNSTSVIAGDAVYGGGGGAGGAATGGGQGGGGKSLYGGGGGGSTGGANVNGGISIHGGNGGDDGEPGSVPGGGGGRNAVGAQGMVKVIVIK